MKEEFLHYIWQLQLFQPSDLISSQGEKITIVHPGLLNKDAGPDFFNAKLYIGDTLWVGNVEIHTHASEWKKHQHHKDSAYNNVILHVAYWHDAPVYNHLGNEIPSIELQTRVRRETTITYENFLQSSQIKPCASQWNSIPKAISISWYERLLIQRLERKATEIEKQLEHNQHHWEQTFYENIAQQFGFKVNAQPFLQVAQSLPLSILAKHKTNLLQIEALLFGQSGLFPTSTTDAYVQKLKKEYDYLQHKYQLESLASSSWKFSKMRPSGFPTVRIAQFAQLIHQSSHLFSACINASDVKEIQKIFQIQIQTEFWLHHYHFESTSFFQQKKLGTAAINSIIINCIIPFLFLYGKSVDNENYLEKGLKWLLEIKAEENAILQLWKKNGIKIADAGESQSLIELHTHYCVLKKCLHCAIGNEILKQTSHDSAN